MTTTEKIAALEEAIAAAQQTLARVRADADGGNGAATNAGTFKLTAADGVAAARARYPRNDQPAATDSVDDAQNGSDTDEFRASTWADGVAAARARNRR